MKAIVISTTILLFLLSGCTNTENEKQQLDEVETMKVSEVGDVVTFGKYEQDNNLENDQEDLTWIVTKIEDDKVHLISEQIIDAKPFHQDFEEITWEDSTIRTWLNSEFKSEAFTEGEQLYLIEQEVENNDYELENKITDGGKNTKDSVFLLDTEEVDSLPKEIIPAKATEFAKANGCFTDFSKGFWWTRSVGSSNKHFLPVNITGSTVSSGTNVNYASFGIRPSIVIDISDN